MKIQRSIRLSEVNNSFVQDSANCIGTRSYSMAVERIIRRYRIILSGTKPVVLGDEEIERIQEVAENVNLSVLQVMQMGSMLFPQKPHELGIKLKKATLAELVVSTEAIERGVLK